MSISLYANLPERFHDIELHNLGFISDRFTWHRGRVRDRLDMGLVNDAWATLFPNATLENMEYIHSNHRPLCVNIEYYNQHEAPNNRQQNI